MEEATRKKAKLVSYLTIPVVFLFVSIVIITSLINMYGGSFYFYPALGLAFFFFYVVEIYILHTRIMTKILDLDRVQRLLEGQENSARLLIRRDLELTRANDKLKELDSRKSEFVSVVAHQLRTPLSGIKWTINMLINGELGPLTNEQKTFLMKSYESNERMVALVDDMLSADRIESGKFQYNFVPTQLTDLFDNVLYELNPAIARKEIKVIFKSHDSKLPRVSVDQEKMRAVIQNLLENAIKYTPQSGRVEIGMQEDGDLIKVMLKDSGIGIPGDQQANVFRRFFRAKNALKVETDGSGLGLFITRGIIEKHGGTIWFESKENEGTTFYFTVKKALN